MVSRVWLAALDVRDSLVRLVLLVLLVFLGSTGLKGSLVESGSTGSRADPVLKAQTA